MLTKAAITAIIASFEANLAKEAATTVKEMECE